MEESESEQSVDDPTKPHWVNSALRCNFMSAIGAELGHVRLGEGSAKNIWFAFLEPSDTCLAPGGHGDREAAKEMVELYFDLEQTVAFDSTDKKDLER